MCGTAAFRQTRASFGFSVGIFREESLIETAIDSCHVGLFSGSG